MCWIRAMESYRAWRHNRICALHMQCEFSIAHAAEKFAEIELGSTKITKWLADDAEIAAIASQTVVPAPAIRAVTPTSVEFGKVDTPASV
jgi:hypothetical protein